MSFARVGLNCCSRVLELGDHQIREYFATHAEPGGHDYYGKTNQCLRANFQSLQ